MSKIATREAYGKALAKLGAENKDIVVLDADLSKSTKTSDFAKEFPDRFFDMGVAEQNMLGTAAGFAAAGKIPFASSFAIFATGRAFEQIRNSIAYPSLNVKIAASHAGISVGEDGASHQSVEDIAIMRALPNMTVIVPADAIETAQAVRAAAADCGPYYIRLPRLKLPVLYDKDYKFELGKAVTMRQGKDATIIAIGAMVSVSLKAAENLARAGIDCRVINMSTLKPIDEEAIVEAAASTGLIVTAEEHLEHGGLGSMVARVVARRYPVPMQFVSMRDEYAESGKPEELLEKYGLNTRHIEQFVMTGLERKKRGSP